MKIAEYGLVAHYISKPAGTIKSDLMYTLSHDEQWPNNLAQINGINIFYNGFHLAQIYADSETGYSNGNKQIVMLFGFPKSDNDREDSERVTFRMISKNKDLRPIIYKVLLDDCKLVVRLPKTDFQQIFCQSLLSCLEIK